MIDREGIMKVIPHRDPFLLLDEIHHVEPGRRAIGCWHIRKDYPVFQGHYPDMPVLPGVLIVESAAQTGAFLVLSDERFAGKLPVFGGIKKAKFRHQVQPGDDLILDVVMERISLHGGRGEFTAKVGENIACEGEVLFAFVDNPKL